MFTFIKKQTKHKWNWLHGGCCYPETLYCMRCFLRTLVNDAYPSSKHGETKKMIEKYDYLPCNKKLDNDLTNDCNIREKIYKKYKCENTKDLLKAIRDYENQVDKIDKKFNLTKKKLLNI